MKDIEIWKDIYNYEGCYKVSNLGNVISLARFNNLGKRVKERVLKKRYDTLGYNSVVLHKNGIGKNRLVHQLVAESFLNHKPNGHKLVVNHKNFIRDDNRLENLEIVTQKENSNKKHLSSSSKYLGVHFFKRTGRWQAKTNIFKTPKHLGYFKTEEEANLAIIKFNQNILQSDVKLINDVLCN